MIELINLTNLPEWFTYPDDFLNFVQSGTIDIGPWQILDGTWLLVRYEGLKKRFPDRYLIPFARRLDNDDVACWDKTNPASVCIVHDFCAPGWESREEFTSFSDWLSTAQNEAKDYE